MRTALAVKNTITQLVNGDINYEIGRERRKELVEITEKYFSDVEGVK